MATLAELKARQRQKVGGVLTPTAQGKTIPLAADHDLALYAVRELGAVCTSGYFEEQAEILLSQAEDTPAWRRRWATLAQAAGWPCWGMTWGEWAKG